MNLPKLASDLITRDFINTYTYVEPFDPVVNNYFEKQQQKQKKFFCVCKAKGFVTSKPLINPSTNISKNMKISNTLSNRAYTTNTGKPQYINSLGKITNVNYLGRTEGQSGGSGKPPGNILR